MPAGVDYGTVTGEFVSFVGDGTTSTPDGTPDEVPLHGYVIFTPTVQTMRWPTLVPPKTAVIATVRCPVIEGVLYAPGTSPDSLGDQGVALVASRQPTALPDLVQYTVSFELEGAKTQPPSFRIDVPSQATVDLTTVMPATPEPGTVVVVSTETAERAEAAAARAEQVVADLEGWEPGGGGGPASWTAITGKPAVIAAGESAVEARAVIGAVSVEDLPDISGLATKTELTSGLAGKQPTGNYATTSALTSGLASKQPVGDYATKTELTSGLATKQPTGNYATAASLATVATTGAYADLTGKPVIPPTPDLSGYATTAALTSGLAEKQPVGDYATKAELPDVSGFATTASLTAGLAGKQDAGDYATTTALSSGLATKQDSGDYATRAELPDLGAYATTAYVDQTVGDIDTVLSGILGGE